MERAGNGLYMVDLSLAILEIHGRFVIRFVIGHRPMTLPFILNPKHPNPTSKFDPDVTSTPGHRRVCLVLHLGSSVFPQKHTPVV